MQCKCAKVIDGGENTYAHTPLKILHYAASTLSQQTVQHKRIITVTQKSESRGPDSLPPEERRAVQGGRPVRGTISFKAKQTIMKSRHFLQE